MPDVPVGNAEAEAKERERLAQMLTGVPNGFGNAATASIALNGLLGTVRYAAKNTGTTRVFQLSARLLRVAQTLGGEPYERLMAMLARVASDVRKCKARLELKPITGMSGYELTVRTNTA